MVARLLGVDSRVIPAAERRWPGLHQEQLRKLIAGPGVYICNECIDRVHAVLDGTGTAARTPIAVIGLATDSDGAGQCSFCGKRRDHVAGMASTGHERICTECIELCDEIFTEDLG